MTEFPLVPPPPTVPPTPEHLEATHPGWELFGGLQCNARHRTYLPAPGSGVFNVVVAADWGALQTFLKHQDRLWSTLAGTEIER